MNKYDLTTVNCTYNYTHSGKVSKYVICTTTMYVVPISTKSYAFCAMLPMVSQVTSMPDMSPGVVQSVLLTTYQVNNKHETIGRLPSLATHQTCASSILTMGHTKMIEYYCRLETIKNINWTRTINHINTDWPTSVPLIHSIH